MLVYVLSAALWSVIFTIMVLWTFLFSSWIKSEASLTDDLIQLLFIGRQLKSSKKFVHFLAACCSSQTRNLQKLKDIK